MKTIIRHKLKLEVETLKTLSSVDLQRIVGGKGVVVAARTEVEHSWCDCAPPR